MADIKSPAERSRNMAAIKGKDTKPEMIVRRFLHREGFRFRLHRKDLPGKPDIVLPKYKTVIFVHGCFWHRHEGCRFATMPATRYEFWKAKFERTKERDQDDQKSLLENGWRILILWECGLKHRENLPIEVYYAIKDNRNSIYQWPKYY